MGAKKVMIKSFQEQKMLSIILITSVFILMIIPLFVGGYTRTLIQRSLLWIPPVFGVYILYSLLRQVHFAQSIFIGIGSYLVAFLAGKYYFTNELLILIPVALVLSIIIASIIGIFLMRRTGFYFAVMGIAMTMVFWSIVCKAREITGGTDGISNIPNPNLLGVQLSNQGLYYVSVVISVLMILLMLRILNSPFSLQLRAIGGDIDKAESIGIPVKRMQRIAFVIAGSYAGISGVLLAFTYNYVGPSNFDWQYGANFIQSAILGGVNYFIGPIVGAFSFVTLDFFLSTWFPSFWEIITGLAIAIIVVTVGEEGITGLVKKFLSKISLEGKYKNDAK